MFSSCQGENVTLMIEREIPQRAGPWGTMNLTHSDMNRPCRFTSEELKLASQGVILINKPLDSHQKARCLWWRRGSPCFSLKQLTVVVITSWTQIELFEKQKAPVFSLELGNIYRVNAPGELFRIIDFGAVSNITDSQDFGFMFKLVDNAVVTYPQLERASKVTSQGFMVHIFNMKA
jgi:hypothetical protein